MNRTISCCLAFSISVLFSCTQPQSPGTQIDDQSTNAPYTIVSATALVKAASQTCPNGGVDIDTGFDENGNAQLDTNEITDTYTICNGDSGLGNLVVIANEPAGGNCTFGGKSISLGVDTDYDGVLESGEIQSVQYFCSTFNIVRSTYFCRVQWTPDEADTTIYVEYLLQEFINKDIQVTADVITGGVGISRTNRWSPWSIASGINDSTYDEFENWENGLVKIYMNVIEDPGSLVDDFNAYWLIGIDRTNANGYVDPENTNMHIQYYDSDLEPNVITQWIDPTVDLDEDGAISLSECAQ